MPVLWFSVVIRFFFLRSRWSRGCGTCDHLCRPWLGTHGSAEPMHSRNEDVCPTSGGGLCCCGEQPRDKNDRTDAPGIPKRGRSSWRWWMNCTPSKKRSLGLETLPPKNHSRRWPCCGSRRRWWRGVTCPSTCPCCLPPPELDPPRLRSWRPSRPQPPSPMIQLGHSTRQQTQQRHMWRWSLVGEGTAVGVVWTALLRTKDARRQEIAVAQGPRPSLSQNAECWQAGHRTDRIAGFKKSYQLSSWPVSKFTFVEHFLVAVWWIIILKHGFWRSRTNRRERDQETLRSQEQLSV